MKEEYEEHHHHHIPCWQKVIFPIWCWKSLIHDKHEAFRFKYNTDSIHRIEKKLMPGIQCQLYVWSAVYYTIMFILPQIAIIHECEKTFEVWLFYVYSAYTVL